jgi:hypothetical protein
MHRFHFSVNRDLPERRRRQIVLCSSCPGRTSANEASLGWQLRASWCLTPRGKSGRLASRRGESGPRRNPLFHCSEPIIRWLIFSRTGILITGGSANCEIGIVKILVAVLMFFGATHSPGQVPTDTDTPDLYRAQPPAGTTLIHFSRVDAGRL